MRIDVGASENLGYLSWRSSCELERGSGIGAFATNTQPRTGIFTSGSYAAKMESFYVFRDLPKFRIVEARLEGPSNLTWFAPYPYLSDYGKILT